LHQNGPCGTIQRTGPNTKNQMPKPNKSSTKPPQRSNAIKYKPKCNPKCQTKPNQMPTKSKTGDSKLSVKILHSIAKMTCVLMAVETHTKKRSKRTRQTEGRALCHRSVLAVRNSMMHDARKKPWSFDESPKTLIV